MVHIMTSSLWNLLPYHQSWTSKFWMNCWKLDWSASLRFTCNQTWNRALKKNNSSILTGEGVLKMTFFDNWSYVSHDKCKMSRNVSCLQSIIWWNNMMIISTLLVLVLLIIKILTVQVERFCIIITTLQRLD